MKRFLNFYYATTNEWMRGEHKFFVVFGAAVYGPSSSGVDYTAEREERLREKRKNVCFHHYITGGPTTQREEVLYEKIKFFSKVFVFFCSSCVLRDYYYRGSRLHRFWRERLREKKGKMYVFPITSSAAHHREREKKFFF